MTLLLLMVFLLFSGIVFVLGMSHQGSARLLNEWLRSVGVFVAALGLLGLSQILLPLSLAWVISSLGMGALTYFAMRARKGGLVYILVPVAIAGVISHLSLALFDIAMSTVEVGSDSQLMAAALNRGLSGSNAPLLALLVLLLLLAAIVGYVLASRKAL